MRASRSHILVRYLDALGARTATPPMRRDVRRLFPRVVAVMALILAPSVVARADPLPPDRVATILVRALAYDRSLSARAGDLLKVAVLFKKESADSAKMAEAITQGMRPLEQIKVGGLAFKAKATAYSGPTDIDALAADGVDAVFVSDGLDADLADIIAATRRVKMTSLTRGEQGVLAGVSVGVADDAGKPKLVINLAATRAEGAQFSSELFQLARVLK